MTLQKQTLVNFYEVQSFQANVLFNKETKALTIEI